MRTTVTQSPPVEVSVTMKLTAAMRHRERIGHLRAEAVVERQTPSGGSKDDV